jgi:hypothetical protein
MNPETKIENRAVDLIYRYLGITSIKLKAAGSNGYPDRLFWLPSGRPLLIEFKVPGGEPEPLQQHTIEGLIEAGYNVQVHDNAIDAFQAAIDAVAATQLSKEGGKILARARRRCAVLRSRAGED